MRRPPPLALVALLVVGPLVAGELSEEGWQRLHEEGGVVVEKRPAEGGATFVRGQAVLHLPLEALQDVLLDLERFPSWIESLSAWEVLAREEATAVVYGRHAFPWPFADRDYVVRYRWREEAGRFTLEARSTTEVARKGGDGVVRLAAVRSRWTLERVGEEKTRVTYAYNGDLGGSFPDFLKESAWKGEAPALFRSLEAEARRRRASARAAGGGR